LVERETPLERCVRGLLARAHKNIVVVALANKLARLRLGLHRGDCPSGVDRADGSLLKSASGGRKMAGQSNGSLKT